MRDGTNGIVMSTEEYFENIERDQQRMFSNLVNPVDLANGFRKATVAGSGEAGNQIELGDENFRPVSYDIPQDSILTSSDTATLSLLALGVPSIAPFTVMDEDIEKNKLAKAELSDLPDEWKEIIEKSNMYQMSGTLSMELDSLFGSDEVRILGGGYLTNMNSACDYVKNMVQTDRDYDKTAELIREGLKGICNAYNSKGTHEMMSAVRGYAYCNLCEKALDLLDRYPVLNESARISKEDREYYEGMRQFAKMIRKNEKLLEREANGDQLTAAKKKEIQQYKDLQYIIAKENLKKDAQDPTVALEIYNEQIRIKNKAVEKCNDKNLSEKEKAKWDTIRRMSPTIGQSGILINKRKEIDFVRQLGKCKDEKAIQKLLEETSKQAAEYKSKNDEDFMTAAEIVDDKIAKIHLNQEAMDQYRKDTVMQANEKNGKNARKQLENSVMPRTKTALQEKQHLITEYINNLDSEVYDKKKHRDEKKHPDFQRMKKAAVKLNNLWMHAIDGNVSFNAEREKEYINELKKAAEAYLNIKDPKKKRELRPDNKYADKRYNLALNLSKLAENLELNIELNNNYIQVGSNQLMADLVKEVMKDASKEEKERFSGVSPEIRRKTVEMVLWRYGMAEKLVSRKLLHDKVNLDSIPKKVKGELKDYLDQMVLFKYGGEAAPRRPLEFGKMEDKKVLEFLEGEIASYKAGTNSIAVKEAPKKKIQPGIKERVSKYEPKGLGKN